MKKNPAFDAYIAKAPDFAKPILTHIRKLVHATVPDVDEEMKWSTPNFMYKGMLCGMAAFKQHCALGFWKASLIKDSKGKPLAGDASAGTFGRITSVDDLPPDKVLVNYIQQAARLNDEGVKVEKPKTKTTTEVAVPPYLGAALKKNKKAAANFASFSPSHRKEYIEWLTDAKTEETRVKRLETALEWIAAGKSRNWKYMK